MERSVHQLASGEGDDSGNSVPALIAVATADLPLLEQGGLGRSQRRALLLSSLGAVFAIAAMGLMVGVLARLAIDLVRDRSEFPLALLIVLMGVGIVWIWLLRGSLFQLWRIVRDLRSGRSSRVDGEVWCLSRQTFGFIPLRHCSIKLADRKFAVRQAIFDQFRPGHWYRVFFAPESGCFLGALALAPLESSDSAAPAPGAPWVPPIAAAPPAADLTAQEREILRLIAAGLSNKEIAARMALSVNTIKMYCSQIYLKLDVHRRTEAVARARELGLL